MVLGFGVGIWCCDWVLRFWCCGFGAAVGAAAWVLRFVFCASVLSVGAVVVFFGVVVAGLFWRLVLWMWFLVFSSAL